MRGRQLLGVGGNSSSGPLVWISAPPFTTWSVVADSSAFPNGTHLAGLASLNGTLVAVGAISQLESERTVYPAKAGPIKERVFALRPSVFVSRTGDTWKASTRSPLRGDGGELTFVAEVGNGAIIVAGIPEGEPGATDGSRASVATTIDLNHWQSNRVGGLTSRFFGVTMMTRVDRGLLVGVDNWLGGRLYSWTPGGSAVRLRGPADGSRVWYTAAAGRDRDLFVSGQGSSGRGRLWTGRPGSWTEVDLGSSMAAPSRVHAMHRVGSSLLLATSADGRSSVLKMEV